MDREIPVANRVVENKMNELRNQRHRETLSKIREKTHLSMHSTRYKESTPKALRCSSSFNERTSHRTQRRVWRSRGRTSKSSTGTDSVTQDRRDNSREAQTRTAENSHCQLRRSKFEIAETAEETQNRKRVYFCQNSEMERRIAAQKPTIKNVQFRKDRQQNLRYLKFIGKFPYEKRRLRSNESELSNAQPNENGDIEVFRKKTDDFLVAITRISENRFVFSVEVPQSRRVMQLTLKKHDFEEQLMKCGYNLDKLIGCLRLNAKGEIHFQKVVDEEDTN